METFVVVNFLPAEFSGQFHLRPAVTFIFCQKAASASDENLPGREPEPDAAHLLPLPLRFSASPSVPSLLPVPSFFTRRVFDNLFFLSPISFSHVDNGNQNCNHNFSTENPADFFSSGEFRLFFFFLNGLFSA